MIWDPQLKTWTYVELGEDAAAHGAITLEQALKAPGAFTQACPSI